MRKLTVTVAAILMASASLAQTGYVSLDGAGWVKASAAERTLWLVGYDDGFTDALKLAASMKSENDNLPTPLTTAGRLDIKRSLVERGAHFQNSNIKILLYIVQRSCTRFPR